MGLAEMSHQIRLEETDVQGMMLIPIQSSMAMLKKALY